ncbi:MAG: type IV toxin-antitoxin system AbiEi family antitoxin [Elusimicrobia bacterium]|nr:type IV toxin-antitoxin system AbiEi family antitoxin [Elusimicrobiota bacterium]
MDTDIEKKIYNKAINALKRTVTVPIIIEDQTPNNYIDKNIDKILRFEVQNNEVFFCAEIKYMVARPTIGFLQMKNDQLPHPILLIARYINPIIAEELKNRDIQFIDTAGNVYINQIPFYVYINGKKVQGNNKQIHTKRIFKGTGLQVLYVLLKNPGMINMPYRKIAKAARVALGTVGWIMKDLRDLGYLIAMGKRGRKIIKKEKLLNRWCVEYPINLKPKLIMGKFDIYQGNWKELKLNHLHDQWGGEAAAAQVTNYLKPQVVTIYTTKKGAKNLIIKNKLRRNPEGEVEIIKRFWGNQNNKKHENTVNPILVYADLLATGNQRNIETGKIIYEQYINRYIRED